ncbi:hypothetical protein Tco_0308760 [Tanacetum coccineum]
MSAIKRRKLNGSLPKQHSSHAPPISLIDTCRYKKAKEYGLSITLSNTEKGRRVEIPLLNDERRVVTQIARANRISLESIHVKDHGKRHKKWGSIAILGMESLKREEYNVVEEGDGGFLGGNSSSGTKKYRGFIISSDGGFITGHGVQKIAGGVIGSGGEIGEITDGIILEFSEELKELLSDEVGKGINYGETSIVKNIKEKMHPQYGSSVVGRREKTSF